MTKNSLMFQVNCLFFFGSSQTKFSTTRGHGDLPDTNRVVGVAGEESLSVGRPRKRQALRWLGLARGRNDFGFQLVDHFLALEIPDLDPRSESGTEPVTIRAEAQSCNNVVVLKGVKMLAIVQIPEHGFAVLQTVEKKVE